MRLHSALGIVEIATLDPFQLQPFSLCDTMHLTSINRNEIQTPRSCCLLHDCNVGTVDDRESYSEALILPC